jgi:hypothetical protein
MNSKNLIIKNYPKMVQEFAEENFNLKTLSASLLVLSFILSALIVYLIKKGPDVIALDAGGDVAKIELKITDAQIVKAAQEYLSNRYSWKPESISSQLKKAEWFVEPTLVNAFQKSMLETQRFVREKKVTQRVYPSDVKVDLKEKKIIVIADRITEFDSLTAATKMKVVLDFTSGERTAVNPWGIYIRKETEGDLR